MHGLNIPPIVLVHLVKRSVAKYSGIIDKHIHLAEMIQCGLYNPLTVNNAVCIGYGLTARFVDLSGHQLGLPLVRTARLSVPDIVYDDTRTSLRELARIGTAQTITGTRNDDNLIIESQLGAHDSVRA